MYLHRVGASQGENAWEWIISRLTELDGPAFRDQVASSLVQMSANAYRYPDTATVDIPSWVLSSKVMPIAPAGGGVHAQVYEVSKPHSRILRVSSRNRAFRARRSLLYAIGLEFVEL